MSGDSGPTVCVPAAIAAAREFGDVRFTLVGREADLQREITRGAPANLDCLYAADVVEMTDHPRDALRRKKDSSMRRAIDLVKAAQSRRLRQRRQHRGADVDGAFRAEDAAGRRASGDRVADPIARRPYLHARSRRERHVHAGAAAPVRDHGVDLGDRSRRRACASAGRPAEYRRRGHQGQRDRAGRAQSCWPRATSIMSASSRATTFSPTRSMSWSPTASRATSR
jgi:hypothetical protein